MSVSALTPFQPTPEELVPFSKNIEEVHEAVRYRIVISTCVTAGMLYSQGLQLGHFSHVFIDEVSAPGRNVCRSRCFSMVGSQHSDWLHCRGFSFIMKHSDQ